MGNKMTRKDLQEAIQSIEDAKLNYCGGYTGPDDEEQYKAYLHGMQTIQNMFMGQLTRGQNND